MKGFLLVVLAVLLLLGAGFWNCPMVDAQCQNGQCEVPTLLQQGDQWRPSQDQNQKWEYAQPTKHRAAVVRIIGLEGGNQRSMGSGVIVKWKGRNVCLTAAHVVKDSHRVFIWQPNRATKWARIQDIDKDFDHALLTGDFEEYPAAELAMGKDATPQPGDTLESVGFGKNRRLVRNVGKAIKFVAPPYARYRDANADWVALGGQARLGDSGGPVYDRRGRVVGILWGTNGNEVLATQGGRIVVWMGRVLPRRRLVRVLPPTRAPAVIVAPRPYPVVQAPPSTAIAAPGCVGRPGGLLDRRRNPQPTPAPPVVNIDLGRIDRRLDGHGQVLVQIERNTRPPDEPDEPEDKSKGWSPMAMIVLAVVVGVGVFYGRGN